VRFFSTRFLSFGEVCFFSTRFLSFGEVCFFSLTRFLSFAGKLCYLRQPCCRMSTCSPRYRVRDNPLVLWTESISSKLLSIDTKMVLLPSIRFFRFRLLRSLGTTQRCRRSNDCCGSLLSCQRSRCASCWGCGAVEIDPKIDTQHSLFLLIDCMVRTLLAPIVSLCRWALDALLLSLLYGAANRLNRLRYSCYCLCWSSRSLVASLLTIDCEQLATRRIDRFNQYNVGCI